ncbi:type III secretion system chaperone [Thalassoglobus polymorphus]|uniref:Uncharacterized protein n=1 Tax=Thalassoglobus polymorphus TaxID=2527994 RepID=A0A517QHE4_9PLAN|nr:type III secretion system chaperone [Thalassoglobus polymorphus]QDT31056.1 hypothetical protein Mal48_02870 [Thalassoglobus polymorphus]
MKVIKSLLVAGVLASVGTSTVSVQQASAQDQAAVGVTEDQLGELISALGLEPEKKVSRYDFAFQTVVNDEEWELSMSAILSKDGSGVWLMAWLDPLPTVSAEVPKTALLRLLAQNDELGGGKFFSYIPATRRFVLQRTIPNEELTSAKLRVSLQDLGASVVQTYPIWSVSNWNPTGIPAAPTGRSTQPASTGATQSAVNESKFEQPIRK